MYVLDHKESNLSKNESLLGGRYFFVGLPFTLLVFFSISRLTRFIFEFLLIMEMPVRFQMSQMITAVAPANAGEFILLALFLQ